MGFEGQELIFKFCFVYTCGHEVWRSHLSGNQDAVHISRLMDVSFGPGRFTRAAYRLREGRACVADLSFVARDGPDGRLAGAIRFWPVLIGDRAALLLGPLAVRSAVSGAGRGHGADRAWLR